MRIDPYLDAFKKEPNITPFFELTGLVKAFSNLPISKNCPFGNHFGLQIQETHTIYTINNIGQKCEGDCGLWVPNEIVLKKYAESLKKIVGAVWELPAK